MSSVDDRIVNMKFNNAQFGQGVDKTKRDITGLESAISKTGRAKGMTDLGSAADGVRVKFSALQVAGAAALGTIVSKATSAGLSLIKSLTLGPIMDGFREYTTNLESVQTIMANSGKSVKVVNKYLGELNEYADQTVYNFSQMAKNIGTFTAAGVELDTATSAIKGISNLAAVSGSSSQQASTAMYQLSQAIAAGRVNLQDWNSVVNAGMGGKIFKNALAQTAVAMGDLSAGAVKVGTDVEIMGTSFRNSISAAAGGEAWLSSEVLVTTLANMDGRFSRARMAAEGYTKALDQNKIIEKERQKLIKKGIVYSDEQFKAMVKNADAAYAAATQIKTATQLMDVVKESIGSMWATAFQLILGDFDQSKKLWGKVGGEVTGIIDGISGTFLGSLREWQERGGRKRVLSGLKNIFGGLLDIMGAVKDAWRGVFPEDNVNILNRLSKVFAAFGRAMKPSEETIDSLKSIFGGFFAILKIGFTIVHGIAVAFSSFFSALFSSSEGARGGLLAMIGTIGEAIMAFERWLTSGGRLTKFLGGIGKVAGAALSPIVAAISLVIDGFGALVSGKGLGGAMDAFNRAGDIFGDFFGELLHGLDELTAPLDPLKDKIASVAEKAIGPFEGLIGKLDEARLRFLDGLGISKMSLDFDALKSKIAGFVSGFSLASIPLEELGDNIAKATAKVKEFVNSLDISDKLKNVRESVSGLFDGLFGGGGGGSKAAASGAAAMTATAESTGSAFEVLGSIMSGVGDAIKATFGFISDVIAGIVDGLSKIPFPDDALEWASLLNMLISGAIIKKLFFSKGMFDTLKESISDISGAIQGSFGQLTDTLKTMQGAIKAEMIKNIAIAVALIAASLIALSFVPQDKLMTGLGGLAAVMGLMAITMNILLDGLDDVKPKELGAKATAILAIGAAMVLMATAVAILVAAVIALGLLPFDALKQGLGAVAILLALLVVSMKALSGNSAKILAAGAAMVLMAAAIDIIVLAVIALGAIPMDTLKQGLAGMAGGLAILTLSLLMLSGNSAKIAAAGAAMVLMATALDILVVAITALGLLPWGVVVQGLKAVGIGLGIMTISLLALSAVGVGALAGGAAMVLLAGALNVLMSVILIMGAAPWDVVKQGLTAMAIALGLLIVAGALAQLIIPGLAALSGVILAIGAAMLMAGTGMALFGAGLALIAVTGIAAIAVISAAIAAFIALLPNIALQMAAAFVTFLQAIALASPKIRKAMYTIGDNMLGTIEDLIPEIGDLFSQLLDTGLDIISNAGTDFAEAGFELIDGFMKSMADHIPSIQDSAIELVTTFTEGIGERVEILANAGMQMMIDIMDGLSNAIEKSDEVRAAARRLGSTFVDELKETFREMIPNISLPDIPLPDVPAWAKKAWANFAGDSIVGGTVAVKMAGDKPQTLADNIEAVGLKVAAAVEGAVRLLVGAVVGPLNSLANQAASYKRTAKYETVRAEQQDISAESALSSAQSQLDDARGKKKGPKRKKAIKKAEDAIKAARKQRKLADAQARKASLAQIQSDYEDQKSRDAISYANDPAGLASASSQLGQDLAFQSQDLLASAQAKAAEIKRLTDMAKKGGKQASEYRKQAAQLRKDAAKETAESMALANQAIEAQQRAVAAYAQARKDAALDVIKRMSEIRDQQKQEADARAWQAEFDANENNKARQIEMLEKRAADNEAAASRAQSDLLAAYQLSDILQAKIGRGETVSEDELSAANKALEAAEKNAALASSAADAAKSDRDQIQSIKDSIASEAASGGGGGGSVITPSRTALEDAARDVDRYTSSVRQAEESAMAAGTTTQFVQNNYSPEALSASTIYRQTNNLISAAEIKMGAN